MFDKNTLIVKRKLKAADDAGCNSNFRSYGSVNTVTNYRMDKQVPISGDSSNTCNAIARLVKGTLQPHMQQVPVHVFLEVE